MTQKEYQEFLKTPKIIPFKNQTKEQWKRDNKDNWDEYERVHGKVKLIEVK